MSLLVVGSVAYDTVKTPFGTHEEILGGSATYFSVAASYFTDVRLVAVIGEDFRSEDVEFLKGYNVDVNGLKRVAGRTFRWSGEYQGDMNEAITHDTQLNVLQGFDPNLPEAYRDSPFVFLANIDPELQLKVLDQVKNPRMVACDTMNFWIHGKLDALKEVLKRVDLIVINDGEAKLLSGKRNLVQAAGEILKMGPRAAVIKRGEYGALMCTEGRFFWAPAYPLETVKDPTGAGDTFAGGVMGYLASVGRVNEPILRLAVYYGSVMASFTVEQFSLGGLKNLKQDTIEGRFSQFADMTRL